MKFRVELFSEVPASKGCIILPVFGSDQLSPTGQKLNELSSGYLNKLLSSGALGGQAGQNLLLYEIPNNCADQLLLLGCGLPDKLNIKQYQKILRSMIEQLDISGITTATLFLGEMAVEGRNFYWKVRWAIEALHDYFYEFTAYKSEPSVARRKRLESLCFAVSSASCLEEGSNAITHGKAVAGAIEAAKNLANLPPNICSPRFLGEEAVRLAKRFAPRLRATLLREADLQELRMGAYLAVSKGSHQEACLSVLEYHGAPQAAEPPIVLIGKGLTFDSGGISLKPGEAMDEMKYDMSGAAAVYGVIEAVANLGLPINLIGLLAGCENMPGGGASRPGDIVTTAAGLTVEILNTDAEGRLVLCDVLTYAARFNPKYVIDIATLTGACVVALGHHTSGLLANNDELATALVKAGDQVLDPAWRLPMGQAYMEQLHSKFADLANIGTKGAGTITAACFLSRFAEKYPWAHLDIAGTAWKSGKEKGGTGRPTALLLQFLFNQVERLA